MHHLSFISLYLILYLTYQDIFCPAKFLYGFDVKLTLLIVFAFV